EPAEVDFSGMSETQMRIRVPNTGYTGNFYILLLDERNFQISNEIPFSIQDSASISFFYPYVVFTSNPTLMVNGHNWGFEMDEFQIFVGSYRCDVWNMTWLLYNTQIENEAACVLPSDIPVGQYPVTLAHQTFPETIS